MNAFRIMFDKRHIGTVWASSERTAGLIALSELGERHPITAAMLGYRVVAELA